MLRLEPNSGGTDEQGYTRPLVEVWTDAARAASIAARQARAMFARKHEPPASKGGGGGKSPAPKKPAKKGERTSEHGERVIDYDDGGTVTVHKDGTATFRNKAGVERKGRYQDPQPKREPAPEGFRDDPEPRELKPKRPKRMAPRARVDPRVAAAANASSGAPSRPRWVR